jgi:hypothetical protein
LIEKKALSLVLIIALIGALISQAYFDLFPLFYAWLQSIISYKWLLTICLLTTLITWYSLRSNPHDIKQPSKREIKRREKQSKDLQDKIMSNLTKAEKELLSII